MQISGIAGQKDKLYGKQKVMRWDFTGNFCERLFPVCLNLDTTHSEYLCNLQMNHADLTMSTCTSWEEKSSLGCELWST